MKYAKHISYFVVLLASLSAFGLSETTNGVTWYYSVVDGNARVTSVYPSSGTVTMPSKLGGYDVTSIATNAFRSSNLLGMTIGNGVLAIGNSAFRGCSRLKTVTIPNSVKTIENFALAECSSLETVAIPDSVEYIGPSAFSSCSGLTRVSIGTGLTRIGSYAFRYCSQLIAIAFEGSCPNNIGDSVFDGVASDCCAYVPRNSSWGVTIPGYWRGIKINWAQYMVHLDANGGTCTPSTIGVERERAMGELPVPSRKSGESATFLGWFTEADGGEEVTSETVINSDMTIYAHWGPVWRYNVNKDGTAELAGYSLAEGAFTIPSEIDGRSIVSIATNAFSGCTGITSVTIPNCVTNIGASAFSGCSGIGSFIVGAGNPAYSSVNGLLLSKDGKVLVGGVNGNVIIPEGVTRIGAYAFDSRSGLTSVTIPDSVRSIGGYAFYNCKNLVGAMTIPDGVTRIEDFTFYNCSGLTSMTIPNTVTSIGSSVFRGCKGFTGIMTIPPSVTSIGTAAFYGCSNLKGVNIEDVAAWCNITFGNAYANPLRYARNLYIDGSPMTDLTIPDSVTSISSNSFYNCTNLLSLAIPTGVTRIGAYSFYGCGGLTNVTVSESVASIDTYAFYNCNRLARMTFSGNAPVIGSSVFVSGSPCTVYVRRASTGWGVTIPGRWNGIAIDYLHYAVTMDANGGTCEMATLDVRDGSSVGALPVPTWGNAVFLGWFTEAEGGARVDESLIVTESTTLYAHWLTEVARPVIVSTLGSVFRADSCEVSITSETEGATIYYTDDGTTPKRYDDYLYAGPMTITDTTTFKAVAVVGGLRSAYTTVTITKHNLTLDEALNVGEGVVLATNPDLPWQPVYDAHAKLGDATARSCAIGNRTNTWFTATVSGAGTMSFWCKVSCEHDDENLFTCDRLMAYTNGVEITDWRMDGETDWTQRTLTFAGGENTVKWVYYKDKSDADGEDCAWVDGIEWTPSAEAMLAVWLAERNLTADTMAANGRTAAECYALGLDPALATNDFRIVSIEMVDGKPKVEWEPMVNRWTGAEIQAVLKGAATLEGPWEDVPEGSGSPGTARPTMRFFKVEVEVQ